MSSRPRMPGEFCWINILSAEPERARDFYARLFDWSFHDVPGMPGGGYIIKVGDDDIGGLWNLHSPQTPAGTPPAIGVMVKTESADRTGAKVKELGGETRDVTDVMDSGRMAVCVDPTGAAFDVWEPRKEAGTQVDPSRHGAPCWFELITSNTDRAAEFYRALFGWTTSPMPQSPMPYTVFAKGDTQVGGMFQLTPEMQGMAPNWATYFTVSDLDAAIDTAKQLGGTICMDPMEVKTVGRMCGINSPQGVMFYALEPE